MSKSKVDQLRLDQIHNMPCICCHIAGLTQFGLQPSRTEAHHIVDGGYRKHSGGHMSTLPLCGWHHRADMPDWRDRKETMLARFGPSLEWQGKEGGSANLIRPCRTLGHSARAIR